MRTLNDIETTLVTGSDFISLAFAEIADLLNEAGDESINSIIINGLSWTGAGLALIGVGLAIWTSPYKN